MSERTEILFMEIIDLIEELGSKTKSAESVNFDDEKIALCPFRGGHNISVVDIPGGGLR